MGKTDSDRKTTSGTSQQLAPHPPKSLLFAKVHLDGKLLSSVALEGPRLDIGRDPRHAISLNHEKISRHHAALRPDDAGQWWIEDYGSRNGTIVNGQAITEPVRIRAGDVIILGKFVIHISSSETLPDRDTTIRDVQVSDNEPGSISTLHAPARLSAEHIELLTDFGHRLLTIDDLSSRFAELCALLVRDNFRARIAAVLRMEDSSVGFPEVLFSAHAEYERSESPLYVSRRAIQAAIQQDQPILACNVPQNAGGIELSISAPTDLLAVIASPLSRESGHVDLLYAVLPPECATADWLALATLATKQFQNAEAAWNARRVSELNAAVEAELAQARQLQQRLVPRGSRIGPVEFAVGFQPCRAIGGDYVDVFELPGGKVLLAVADVCGKGLPAALVAFSVHTLIHAAMRRGAGIVDAIAELNAYLCESLPEGRFVTLFAALLDTLSGEMQYVNSGHPAGLIVDGTGRSRELSTAENFPLGLGCDPIIPGADQLKPNELLMLFTDGVPDLSLKSSESLLGTENLAALVGKLYSQGGKAPLAQLATELGASLDELQNSQVLQDDRTFLLLRRGP